MYRYRLDANVYIKLLLVFFLIPHQLKSQILPKEGSVLNYRLIGFSFPREPYTHICKLEIAIGNYNTEDSFKKNIIKTISCKDDKVIGEVSSFGAQYTWRVVYGSGISSTIKSDMHHFSTGTIPEVDTSVTRLRILKKSEQYKGAYLCLNGTRALYDMNGAPVWYLPDIAGQPVTPRDLKLSPQGTITFLFNDDAYEVNYNGNVLWKAPNNGEVNGNIKESYHHEFTRLTNGHYMTLGLEIVNWPFSRDGSLLKVSESNTMPGVNNQKAKFGTIIEYDEKGKVVWSWKSSNYFIGSDLRYYMPTGKMKNIDVHENAFFFDEKNGVIYVSFKGISRVLKVKYPEGNVLNSYGEVFSPGCIGENGNGLFCDQHGCKCSEKGDLFLYNNNDCNLGMPPEVIMMKQPLSDNDGLKKIWEFECPVDSNSSQKFSSGGNVVELHDNSIFVAMEDTYSRIFIVNLNKEILWNAISEKRGEDKKWHPIPQYRSSIITDPKMMERLLWNTAPPF